MLIKLSLIYYFFATVQCARILGITPTPSFSHQVAFRPIFKELSRKGHQITLITANPMRNPNLTNITEIDISLQYDILKKYKYQEKVLEFGSDIFKMFAFMSKVHKEITENIYTLPAIENLIHNKNVNFDLVMIEYLLPSYFLFAHRFNVPFIALSSMETSYLGHDCFGNPTHPVLNPDVFLPFSDNLNLLQRIKSTFSSVYARYYMHGVLLQTSERMEKYFGTGYPPLHVIMCSADLLFLNVNPILDNIRPSVPAVVNMGGGMHIEPSKPLPKV